MANSSIQIDLPDVEPTNEELAALEIEVDKILPELTGIFDMNLPLGGLVGLDAFDDLTVYVN